VGWAERASRKELHSYQKQAASLASLKERLVKLKKKIAAGETLTDADHRAIALAGPVTLEWLGYQPTVTLQ
jgi:hypothetical protein